MRLCAAGTTRYAGGLFTGCGKLSDRMQPRLLASIGVALTLVGVLLLLNANRGTDLLPFIVSQLLIGFGTALFASPNTNAIMSSIEKKVLRCGSAIQATSRDIGITLEWAY